MTRAGGFFGQDRGGMQIGAFSCQLAKAVIPPSDVPYHVHDDAHFVLAFDRGYVSAAFGERPTDHPCALVFNPPGTDHRDRFADEGGRFLGIRLPAELSPVSGSPFGTEDPRLRAFALRIAGAIADGGDPLLLEEDLLDLLATIGGHRQASRMPAWLLKSRDTLRRKSHDSGLTITALANEAGVHPVHFSRTYCGHFGLGPAEAIQRHRLERAAASMGGHESLADIAAANGFCDQAHLSRTMRRLWGVSPARLRSALA